MTVFFDTFALVEFLAGNEETRKHGALGFVTTKWNLAELLVLDVRDFGEKTANRNFRRLLGAAVREEDADLIAAARMKVSHAVRGRRFSFVDCLGFCVARRLKMRFVTGDEAFKGVPGVLFLMDVTSSRGTSAPRTSNVSSP